MLSLKVLNGIYFIRIFAMALRSDVHNSLKEIKKLKNNVLPSNAEIIGSLLLLQHSIN